MMRCEEEATGGREGGNGGLERAVGLVFHSFFVLILALVPIPPVPPCVSSQGPTQFLLGSHVKGVRKGNADWWEGRQHASDAWVKRLEAAPTAEEGSVVLFDLRLRHRGGANRSPAPRPILYVST